MSLIYDVERCLRSKGPMTELDLAIELDAESKRISSAIRSLLSRHAVEKDGGRWRLRSSDAQAPGPILSERQQTIVTFTRRYGPIAATKIAEGCGVPGGSIHGLLMRLQELGVIRKGAGGWEAIEDDSTHAAESAEESADKRAPGAWAPGEWDRMERERVEKELAWVRTELSVIGDFVTAAFPFAPKDLPTRDRLTHVAQRIGRLETSGEAVLRGEVLDELRVGAHGPRRPRRGGVVTAWMLTAEVAAYLRISETLLRERMAASVRAGIAPAWVDNRRPGASRGAYRWDPQRIDTWQREVAQWLAGTPSAADTRSDGAPSAHSAAARRPTPPRPTPLSGRSSKRERSAETGSLRSRLRELL